VRLLTAAVLSLAASGCAFSQTYTINTFAGNGSSGFSGDSGPAASAQLDYPWAVAADSAGNLYIADTYNQRIRKIANGVISTVAGNGTPGFSGDGGPATSAELNYPSGVAVDSAGNLYIADYFNQRIRKVSNGTITTVAGIATWGFSGDNGPATSAQLNYPNGVAVDSAGNLYIADTYNYRIRKVSNGTIVTVAGGGSALGDGGPATSALLSLPYGVAADIFGNLYIADAGANRIRKVTDGTISTVAGNGTLGFSGDGGAATGAQMYSPFGVAVDSGGDLFIADTGNARVREVQNGVISTIAGNGTPGYGGDGGPAVSAMLDYPSGVAVGAGAVYVADADNGRVRALIAPPSLGGIVNSASYAGGGVAPGEIVAIFGSGMGPGGGVAPAVVDATTLAGVQVLIGGVAAPLLYVQATQVNAVVPYEVAGKTSTQVQVVYGGQNSNTLTVPVVAAAPGIFTLNEAGSGAAVVLNQNGTLNSSGNPAAPGSAITVYATGEGQTNPAGIDGQLDPSPPPQPVQSVTATIGGASAAVESASGIVGGVAGILQVKLQVPAALAQSNAAPLVVSIGGIASQGGVTVSVQ
jgi:uncharacterized protein (TIGR03437 family)